jgi:hypothetical protein
LKKKINSISKKMDKLDRRKHLEVEVDLVKEKVEPEVRAVDSDEEAI